MTFEINCDPIDPLPSLYFWLGAEAEEAWETYEDYQAWLKYQEMTRPGQ